jgi:hypothetical protein
MQSWVPPSACLVRMGGNACDFCNTCPAERFYRCNNFELNGLPLFRNGPGNRAACLKCADLVDTERWARLSERAFQKFMKHHAVPRHSAVVVRLQFADVVRLFAIHRLSEL